MDMEHKIMVIVEDYPDLHGNKAMMFVHTRNKTYMANGLNIIVLSFSAKNNYVIDDIPVITYEEYLLKYAKDYFAILISHAANLRHHFKFINKHGNQFKKFFFFFHGHEILPVNKVYPKPYAFVKDSSMTRKYIRNIYDNIKFIVWRKFIKKYAFKSQFIFVSNWMYQQFEKWIKVELGARKHIIYNGVDKEFENNQYVFSSDYKYDCITIRGNLDGSKYCIDIVNNIASNNKKLQFLVVGKGDFFSHFEKSENIQWINGLLTAKEIIDLLNDSRCALMPTKTDAQGLMMCEFATYGIPLITSDISVCREVLEGFDNIKYISNDDADLNFEEFVSQIDTNVKRNKKFFEKNTVIKEIKLMRAVFEDKI